MKLASLAPATRSQAAPPSAQVPPASGGSSGKDDQDNDAYLKSMVENPGLMQGLLSGLSVGKKVAISVKGEEMITATMTGTTVFDQALNGGKNTLRATADLITQYSDTDPLITLRAAAIGVKPTINSLPVGEGVTKFTDSFLMPGIRATTLALDLPQAIRTVRSPDASKLDKGLEIAHIATDVAGLVGAVAIAMPGVMPAVISKNAEVLLGTSIAADILVCGYRALSFARRGDLGRTEHH